MPGGGCWIERRWRRCGSVGGIGWERGDLPLMGGEKGGGIVWVRGVGVVCVRVVCRGRYG